MALKCFGEQTDKHYRPEHAERYKTIRQYVSEPKVQVSNIQLIISDTVHWVHWASQHPILILNSCSVSSLGAAATKLSRIDSLEACAIHFAD